MTDPQPSRRRSRWRRLLIIAVLGYLGIIIVLLALERKFIFIPTPARRDWREPPDARIVDLELPTSAGDRVHAWWLPNPGANLTVLYSHGNAGNLSHRGNSIIRWAQELNASVLIYDYPGYGRSTGKPDETSCYAAADAGWNWLTTTQGRNEADIVLVGASLGGAMATHLAENRDCRALILIKAFSSIPDMASHRFPWLPVRYLVRSQFDSVAKLPNCRSPVFLVHGTNDGIVPYACAERLLAAAPEPKELLTLDGNDHNDALPGEFFPRLRTFLEAHARK